jgi:hypothetical protein
MGTAGEIPPSQFASSEDLEEDGVSGKQCRRFQEAKDGNLMSECGLGPHLVDIAPEREIVGRTGS